MERLLAGAISHFLMNQQPSHCFNYVELDRKAEGINKAKWTVTAETTVRQGRCTLKRWDAYLDL